MKYLVLVAALFSSSAFASELPANVRAEMLSYINAKCSVYNLVEGATERTSVPYDQGERDVYYATTFTGSFNFDGAHPVQTTVEITAVTDLRESFVEFSKLNADVDGACGK